MKVYRVTLLGESFIIEADSNYEARRKASEEYRKKEKVEQPLVYLCSQCTVRVSDKDDGRVRYPAVTSEVP